MGKLLFGGEEPKSWYIGDDDRFVISLVWIYEDQIWYENESPLSKILIRKFIENELSGDVYITQEYFQKQTHQSAWDSSGYSRLNYLSFLFDEEADATAFKIKFGESVKLPELIDKLKENETRYERSRREAQERGEYWQDRQW